MSSTASVSKTVSSAAVGLMVMFASMSAQAPGSKSSSVKDAAALEKYGNLPLSFEANVGQAGEAIRFLSRSAVADTLLTETGAQFMLKAATSAPARPGRDPRRSAPQLGGDARLEMTLVGARPSPIAGVDQMPGKSHYLIGDPSRWHTDVPSFGKVKYAGVYPGVDLVYYGNQRQLEYDFVVAPGSDPRSIELGFHGMDSLSIDAEGNLVLQLQGKKVIQKRPYAYQNIGGEKREVAAGYQLSGADRVAFRIGRYDVNRALVIDPVLAFSSYLGGSGADQALAVAVDALGNAYVAGYTSSTNFPVSAGAFERVPGGGYDAFVTKLTADGSAIVYSTYLGGSGDEFAYGIAVDSQGNAYLVGDTNSTNFPTVNALQTTLGGNVDAFVSKLNPSGSALVYSTYLGGNGTDDGLAIAVDAQGFAYVVGDTISPNFPLHNALQGTLGGGYDAYLAKFSAAGNTLVFSTFLGGTSDDYAYAVSVDSVGNAYVAGLTGSVNFPTAHPMQATLGGRSDAFVSKFNATGSALVYSTYLGGASDDWANGIALDSSGAVYLVGQTSSTNFPTEGPIQGTLSGSSDAFVAKLNSAGSALVYSTFLGGTGAEVGMSIAVDGPGNAHVVGYTNSTNFPLVAATQSAAAGGYDAFVAKLNAGGSALQFSTYLGGNNDDFGAQIAVDGSENFYVVGSTLSANLPTVNALQPTYGGASDAFIAKFGSFAVQVASITPNSQVSTAGIPITITGLNFAPGATVTLGGAAATQVAVQSTTRLSAVTPTHDPGVVDVVVTNPNGQGGRLVGAFTYVAHPSLTAIDAPSGSSEGGTVVTLTGANLASGATVSFGGTAASSVVVNSATSITATTPAHAAGAVDVLVANPDGQQATLSAGYTFVDPPPPSPGAPSNSSAPAQGCAAAPTAPSALALLLSLGAALLLRRRSPKALKVRSTDRGQP